MIQIVDTQSFLWYIEGDSKLSLNARQHIEDTGARNYLSVASLWEMSIKCSNKKLHLTEPFNILIPREIKNNGFELLEIKIEHTNYISVMPFYKKVPADPFDRLIIAQGIVECWPIISCDAVFDNYPVNRIW